MLAGTLTTSSARSMQAKPSASPSPPCSASSAMLVRCTLRRSCRHPARGVEGQAIEDGEDEGRQEQERGVHRHARKHQRHDRRADLEQGEAWRRALEGERDGAQVAGGNGGGRGRDAGHSPVARRCRRGVPIRGRPAAHSMRRALVRADWPAGCGGSRLRKAAVLRWPSRPVGRVSAGRRHLGCPRVDHTVQSRRAAVHHLTTRAPPPPTGHGRNPRP
jgi:hypothetical protein